MTTISYSRLKGNLLNDTINYSGFFKRFGTSINLLAKLDTVIVDGGYILAFKYSNYVSTRWLVISFLTGYLSEFSFSRYTFSRDNRKHGHGV